MTAPTTEDLLRDLVAALTASTETKLRPNKTVTTLSATDANSWQAWRSNFELTVAINRWDHRRARLELASSMTGTAKSYVEHIPHRADVGLVADVQLLLDAYEACFMPAAAADVARLAFDAAKQQEEETLTAWHARLRNIHSRAYPNMIAATRATDRGLIDRFAVGLLDESICDLLLDHRPDTYAECLATATLKCANQLTKQARRGNISNNGEKSILAMNHNQRAELCALTSSTPTPTASTSAPFGSRDTRKCYNCNKIGHISRDCRQKKKPNSFKPRPNRTPRQFGARPQRPNQRRSINNMVQELLDEVRTNPNNYTNDTASENC